jgi:hypothetical protein
MPEKQDSHSAPEQQSEPTSQASQPEAQEAEKAAPGGPAEKAAAGEPQEAPAAEPFPDVYQVLRFCFGLLVEQAWIHLGLLAPPGHSQTRVDLGQARVAIAAAVALHEQLKPFVDSDEGRRMELELTNLRLNFARKAG